MPAVRWTKVNGGAKDAADNTYITDADKYLDGFRAETMRAGTECLYLPAEAAHENDVTLPIPRNTVGGF